MKICASVYVDNQDDIQFPVEFITKNFDFFEKIYFFGSDGRNTDLLRAIQSNHPLKHKIHCESIDKKIYKPTDIAVAQNACVEYLKDKDDSDFFTIVQADTLLTDRAFKFIKEWAKPENTRYSYHLTVRHIRFYIIAHQTYFGVTLMGRNDPHRFVQDGAYLEGNPHFPHPWNCLDIGYFDTETYYRHVLRHSLTWTENVFFQRAPEAYRRSKKEFIELALEYMAYCETKDRPIKLVSPDIEPYRSVIKHFNLEKDYQEVLGILTHELRERPEILHNDT